MKFLKTVCYYCFSLLVTSVLSQSNGVKAWGQFVDIKLKHIFCGRHVSRTDGQLTGLITGQVRGVEVRLEWE